MEAEELVCALVASWWVGTTKGEVDPEFDSSLAKNLVRATRNALAAYRIGKKEIRKP